SRAGPRSGPPCPGRENSLGVLVTDAYSPVSALFLGRHPCVAPGPMMSPPPAERFVGHDAESAMASGSALVSPAGRVVGEAGAMGRWEGWVVGWRLGGRGV